MTAQKILKLPLSNKILLVLCCAFLLPLVCAAPVHAVELMGQWSGTVYQTPAGSSSSYPAQMALNGDSGSMDYPSLQCGGQLAFLRQDGNTYYYRETITYGKNKCITGGTISVVPTGNSVQWNWDGSYQGTRYLASGTLTGSRRLQTCAECSAARDRCFSGCNNEPNLIEQNRCVNQCNHDYNCVMGYDCK